MALLFVRVMNNDKASEGDFSVSLPLKAFRCNSPTAEVDTEGHPSDGQWHMQYFHCNIYEYVVAAVVANDNEVAQLNTTTS